MADDLSSSMATYVFTHPWCLWNIGIIFICQVSVNYFVSIFPSAMCCYVFLYISCCDTFLCRIFCVFSWYCAAIIVYGLLYFAVCRFIESHWFVWTTQMSHIPMEVDYDKNQDWVTIQLKATCNVEQSWFNDWFSGHLNFQIEHQ